MKANSKEVAKRPEAGLPAELSGNWGAAEGMDVSDLKIPQILVMNKTSKLLDRDDAAKTGQLRDNISGAFLGDEVRPLSVCVFHWFKTWGVYTGEKFDEFVRTEPFTPKNANRPWNDGEYEYNLVQNYYCLNVGVPAEESFPYLLSLQRTSTDTAKKMNTLFSQLAKINKPSAAKVLDLFTVKCDGKKGVYWIVDFKIGADTSLDHLRSAFEWHKKIASGAVKVEVHDEHASDDTALDPEVTF